MGDVGVGVLAVGIVPGFVVVDKCIGAGISAN